MAAGDEFTYVTSSTAAAAAGEEEEEGGALIEEEQEVALTCPEGCGPGDTILVTLPDGSEAEAVVPEGVAAWGAILYNTISACLSCTGSELSWHCHGHCK